MNPQPTNNDPAGATYRDLVPGQDVWQEYDESCSWDVVHPGCLLIGCPVDGTLQGRRPVCAANAAGPGEGSACVGGALFIVPNPAADEMLAAAQEIDRQIALLFWSSDDGENMRPGTPEDDDGPTQAFNKAWKALRAALASAMGGEK